MGPSGAGKSTFLRTALEELGSGVVALALGTDELESYRSMYEDADFLVTEKDAERLIQQDSEGKHRLVSEKPYLFAAFDDGDFYPSLGSWQANGHKSLVSFLRLVHSRIVTEGKSPWAVLGLDTFSGAGELAHNAMCSTMRITEPPKARGEGGAQYYIGYRGKLQEVARACRSIKGHGLHWIATSHVQIREASDTYGPQDVAGKEQQMALFTGAFREAVPGFFDIVAYAGIDAKKKHYLQPTPDRFRSSKSRYVLRAEALDEKGRFGNSWQELEQALARS
jgi:hypothetical protein